MAFSLVNKYLVYELGDYGVLNCYHVYIKIIQYVTTVPRIISPLCLHFQTPIINYDQTYLIFVVYLRNGTRLSLSIDGTGR